VAFASTRLQHLALLLPPPAILDLLRLHRRQADRRERWERTSKGAAGGNKLSKGQQAALAREEEELFVGLKALAGCNRAKRRNVRPWNNFSWNESVLSKELRYEKRGMQAVKLSSSPDVSICLYAPTHPLSPSLSS